MPPPVSSLAAMAPLFNVYGPEWTAAARRQSSMVHIISCCRIQQDARNRRFVCPTEQSSLCLGLL